MDPHAAKQLPPPRRCALFHHHQPQPDRPRQEEDFPAVVRRRLSSELEDVTGVYGAGDQRTFLRSQRTETELLVTWWWWWCSLMNPHPTNSSFPLKLER